MKNNVIFSFIILISITTTAFTLNKEFLKSNPIDIVGTWNLQSYGYNTHGGSMDFRFVQNVKYVFDESLSGKIIQNDSIITPFNWILKKKKLTLTFANEVKEYMITTQTPTDLIIVDTHAGTDERGKYVAYEKGLMFKK